jgi:Zn finger protein HypA/HybF involved in hydrogenase expression
MVFCWHCGAQENRATTGLYAPCDHCRSTDIHVISTIEHATMAPQDVRAAVERHRATVPQQ